jgi:alpha/beta superfamily hydrolase
VVRTLARAANEEGYVPLMFNFRGAGRSTGSHTGGLAETADVDAAMRYGHDLAGDGNVMLMGYSFGAMVATRWLNEGGRAACFVAVSVPANADDPDYEGVPSLFVNGEYDDIAPLDDGMRRAEMIGGLHVIVEDTDHFFRVGLLELEEAVRGFIGISCTKSPGG